MFLHRNPSRAHRKAHNDMKLISLKNWTMIWLFVWTTSSNVFLLCHGLLSYEDEIKIFTDKLLGPSAGYNTAVRPLNNVSNPITVTVSFHILAIVEINAVSQKFVTNAFMGMYWRDERLEWNPEDYGEIRQIHPYPKDIWRPRLIISNTLGARDLFADDYSPTTLESTGNVVWFPGSLFPVSCKLNLLKYPFDTQDCMIQFYSMGLHSPEILFVPNPDTPKKIDLDFYVKSGEWVIEDTSIVQDSVPDSPSGIRMNFHLRRLPGFFIMNIVIPIVLMSFLNILVFLIPVDSGEKISYGITVLLALTVFMSIVSEQLPRSSDILPLVTIYLLVLTVISVCTVIMSIVIVFFHYREEKEEMHQRASNNFKGVFGKIKLLNRAADNFVKVNPVESNSIQVQEIKNMSSDETKNVKEFQGFSESKSCGIEGVGSDKKYVNRWKQIGKHLDCISFIVFFTIWVSVTIAFLIEMDR